MIPSFAAARFITFGPIPWIWFDHTWRSRQLAEQQLNRIVEMFGPQD
jgi:hypothetical protein